MKRRPSAAVGASLLAVLVLATQTAAAPVAKLTGGTVTPSTGTTATAFQFSVHFVGSATDEAATVIASVAGGTRSLSLTSGDTRNGTWTGSSMLPVGSWTVTYQSTSSAGTNPTFVVPGQVVVTASPPPPTAQPTPASTPTPLPAPTATPRPGATVQPGISPTPFGTTVTEPGESPQGSVPAATANLRSTSPSPSASPGGGESPKQPLSVPVEGVVAIGLLGVVAAAAALGERRRRRAVEAFRAAESGEVPFGGPVPDGQGPPEGWEDDETVGSIEYETPDHLREASDELAGDATDEPGR